MSGERGRTTKKEIILRKAEELRLLKVYRRDLERINEELRRELGEGGLAPLERIPLSRAQSPRAQEPTPLLDACGGARREESVCREGKA